MSIIVPQIESTGSIILEKNNYVQLNDSTNVNSVQLTVPSIVTSWIFTLPSTAGTTGQILNINSNGASAWSSNISVDPIAIGVNAGSAGQHSQSVAIGYGAG